VGHSASARQHASWLRTWALNWGSGQAGGGIRVAMDQGRTAVLKAIEFLKVIEQYRRDDS
jgi:hypothetical protein